MKRSTALILLVLVLLTFSTLVFHQLSDQGFLNFDPAEYLLEAKFVSEGLHMLKTLNPRDFHQQGFWEDIKTKTNGIPPGYARPGYILILWAVGTLTKFSDTMIQGVTAVCGILGLYLTFLVAKKIGGLPCALYATTVLVSSTFYMVYARGGMVELLTANLFLLGTYWYLRSLDSRATAGVYWTGLAAGYAFATNHWRSTYVPAVLIFMDCVAALQQRWDLKFLLRRVAFFALGFLTLLVVFQVPYVIATLVVGPLPPLIRSYWTQVIGWWNYGIASGKYWFHDIGELARCFWTIEGPIWSTLVVAGWIFLIARTLRKKRLEDILILCSSFIPFLFLSLTKSQGVCFSRPAVGLIPPACIAVGQMFWGVQSYLESRWSRMVNIRTGVVLAVMVAMLGFSIPRITQFGMAATGYAQAKLYLGATGEKKFLILGNERIWRYYLGRHAFDTYTTAQTTKEWVLRAHAQGTRYGIVDYSTLYSQYAYEYVSHLVGRCRPIAVIPNPRGNSLAYLIDDLGFEGARVVSRDPFAGFIFVYSMNDIVQSLERFASEPSVGPRVHL